MAHSVPGSAAPGAVARVSFPSFNPWLITLSGLTLASSAALAQTAAPIEVGRLAPIVVTATRFAEPAATLPFGVSVLTAEQLRESGVGTVNEAIMKLLGVPGRLDFFGGGDYALDLRGFGATADSNQVVIVDGIRVSEADLGGTRLAGIAIDAVERIEVIRGNGSVLYGEGATAGVIVVTTKAGRGTARENSAQLYAGVGSYGTRELRAGGTLAAGAFSVDVAANRRKSDNHRENFESDVDGASVAAQWANDWLRVGARHARDDLDTGLPGALSAAQYAANPRQTNAPDDRGSIRNERSGVFTEAEFGAWQLGLDLGWRDKSLRSVNGGFAYDYDVDARNHALRAKHRTTIASAVNSLVIGMDHGEWTRRVLGDFGSTATQRSRAFYVRDDIALAAGTRLNAGWRTERIDKDNSSTAATIDQTQRAWELGVVQPVAEGVAVYARVGKSFRLANVDEFGFTTPGVAVRPQTSRDTEVGARWAHASGRAELRAYRSALTDEIGYDPSAPGPFGPGANTNFDPTRRQGVELEVAQRLGASTGLRLNAAARRAQFRAGSYDGQDVPLTPRRSVALRVDWAPLAGHRLDAGVHWVSSQHPDFDNACVMPSYATADLRYAYRWRAAELALGIANLTDRKYYTQAFSCDGGETSAIYPEPGRAVTASLRWQF